MRVGGGVEWLLEPADPSQLLAAWNCARERGLRTRLLGGGANLIIEEGLHAGVVIATERLARLFRPDPLGEEHPLEREENEAPPHLLTHDVGPEDPRLIAWSGVGLLKLVRTASQLGWAGLEGLAGVPGHVGGGVTMNAGGRAGELWDVVESVRVIDHDGCFKDLQRDECEPRYRDGNLDGRVVVGAVFRLRPENKGEVRERTREYLRAKNAVQPVSERSSGCVFKNPDPEESDGRTAGQLVDQCGGKGLRRGGAVVSERHGNFIVNTGGATATDLLTLIEDVRDLVAQKTGVVLRGEARVWRHSDPA